MSSQDKIATPEAAAQGLFEAFGRHDRAAAARFASEAAIMEGIEKAYSVAAPEEDLEKVMASMSDVNRAVTRPLV